MFYGTAAKLNLLAGATECYIYTNLLHFYVFYLPRSLPLSLLGVHIQENTIPWFSKSLRREISVKKSVNKTQQPTHHNRQLQTIVLVCVVTTCCRNPPTDGSTVRTQAALSPLHMYFHQSWFDIYMYDKS